MSGIARIRPSRRFLIQQAVLNAVSREYLGHCQVGAAELLSFDTSCGRNLPGWLEAAVCREFRALSERWAA